MSSLQSANLHDDQASFCLAAASCRTPLLHHLTGVITTTTTTAAAAAAARQNSPHLRIAAAF